jgi:hypothetical protein
MQGSIQLPPLSAMPVVNTPHEDIFLTHHRHESMSSEHESPMQSSLWKTYPAGTRHALDIKQQQEEMPTTMHKVTAASMAAEAKIAAAKLIAANGGSAIYALIQVKSHINVSIQAAVNDFRVKMNYADMQKSTLSRVHVNHVVLVW